MKEGYDYPVWGTQGGGLVKKTRSGVFVFIEAPTNVANVSVGDEMPRSWGTFPANTSARNYDRDQARFNEGLDQFFETLLEQVDEGKVGIGQADRFFLSRRHA